MEPRFGSRLPWLRAITASGEPQPRHRQLDRELAAGRGWPVRTLIGCSVRTPAVLAPATKCSVCGLSFAKPLAVGRSGGTGDTPVESLFPPCGGGTERGSFSGWSRVLGIDAVGGPPDCDFADEGGGTTSRYSPR